MIETVSSTAIGFVISYLLNVFALPLLGIVVSHAQNVSMIVLFTSVSLIRQYFLRRMFNKIHQELLKTDKPNK